MAENIDDDLAKIRERKQTEWAQFQKEQKEQPEEKPLKGKLQPIYLSNPSLSLYKLLPELPNFVKGELESYLLELDTTKKPKPLKVVDVGAGKGDLLMNAKEVLDHHGKRYFLFAVETDTEAFSLIPDPIQKIDNDATDLSSFKDKTMDIYFSVFTMAYAGNRKKMVSEMARVLVPGGIGIHLLMKRDSISSKFAIYSAEREEIKCIALRGLINTIETGRRPNKYFGVANKLKEVGETEMAKAYLEVVQTFSKAGDPDNIIPIGTREDRAKELKDSLKLALKALAYLKKAQAQIEKLPLTEEEVDELFEKEFDVVKIIKVEKTKRVKLDDILKLKHPDIAWGVVVKKRK